MDDTPRDVEVRRDAATAGRPSAAPAMGSWDPIGALRHQIDRVFEDLEWPPSRSLLTRLRPGLEPFGGWAGLGGSLPAVDLTERDGAYELRAELPGLASEDVEVTLGDGLVTIKGEKSTEREEKDEAFHLRERSHGRFQRSLRLPTGIDADKVEARFDKGVLTVTLPKSAQARETERKVEIKSA